MKIKLLKKGLLLISLLVFFIFLASIQLATTQQPVGNGAKIDTTLTTTPNDSVNNDIIDVPYVGKSKLLYSNGKVTKYYRPVLKDDIEKELYAEKNDKRDKGWVDEIIGLLSKTREPENLIEWLGQLGYANGQDAMKAYKVIVKELENRTNDTLVRKAALNALNTILAFSGISDEQTLAGIDLIKKYLSDTNIEIKTQSALILTVYGEKEETKKVLLTELNNKSNRKCEDCGCRQCISTGLLRIGKSQDIVDALKSAAIDDEEKIEVRLSMIDVLTEFSEKNVAKDVLVKASQMVDDKWTRMRALAILSRQEEWDTIKQSSLNDKDEGVRKYSKELLLGCKVCDK